MNAQANTITVAIEEDNEATLSERIADRIEDAACAAYEATVCAVTRTEVIVTALVEATPRIREVAKSKAEARMAARLAKYN